MSNLTTISDFHNFQTHPDLLLYAKLRHVERDMELSVAWLQIHF